MKGLATGLTIAWLFVWTAVLLHYGGPFVAALFLASSARLSEPVT